MQRLGKDARGLRLGLGWTQQTLAQRAGTSQASVARLEAGDDRLALAIPIRVFAALGYDLPLRTFPGDGVALQDSGQLALAEEIRSRAHPSLRVVFEEPTGEGKQAADMVLLGQSSVTHVELESGRSDVEGQLRRGRLKRDALQRRFERSVSFVLALRDTDRNRAAIAAHAGVIQTALPASSREVLESIERGEPLARDGLLWLRPARHTQTGQRARPPFAQDSERGLAPAFIHTRLGAGTSRERFGTSFTKVSDGTDDPADILP